MKNLEKELFAYVRNFPDCKVSEHLTMTDTQFGRGLTVNSGTR